MVVVEVGVVGPGSSLMAPFYQFVAPPCASA
jgi:hypothetical protein